MKKCMAFGIGCLLLTSLAACGPAFEWDPNFVEEESTNPGNVFVPGTTELPGENCAINPDYQGRNQSVVLEGNLQRNQDSQGRFAGYMIKGKILVNPRTLEYITGMKALLGQSMSVEGQSTHAPQAGLRNHKTTSKGSESFLVDRILGWTNVCCDVPVMGSEGVSFKTQCSWLEMPQEELEEVIDKNNSLAPQGSSRPEY